MFKCYRIRRKSDGLFFKGRKKNGKLRKHDIIGKLYISSYNAELELKRVKYNSDSNIINAYTSILDKYEVIEYQLSEGKTTLFPLSQRDQFKYTPFKPLYQDIKVFNGEYLAVMLPDDATNIFCSNAQIDGTNSLFSELVFDDSTNYCRYEDAPMFGGTHYDLIGRVADISELVAKKIVEGHITEKSQVYDRWRNYYKPVVLTYPFTNPLDSFKSLMVANNIFTTNPYSIEHPEYEKVKGRVGNWIIMKKLDIEPMEMPTIALERFLERRNALLNDIVCDSFPEQMHNLQGEVRTYLSKEQNKQFATDEILATFKIELY